MDVIQVDWCNFKAIVEMVGDDLTDIIGQREEAQLLELNPISVDEDKESVDRIKESVKAMDLFRFFINYLW